MATIQDLESADLRVIRGDDGRITSIVDTWGRDVGLVSSRYNSVTGGMETLNGQAVIERPARPSIVLKTAGDSRLGGMWSASATGANTTVEIATGDLYTSTSAQQYHAEYLAGGAFSVQEFAVPGSRSYPVAGRSDDLLTGQLPLILASGDPSSEIVIIMTSANDRSAAPLTAVENSIYAVRSAVEAIIASGRRVLLCLEPVQRGSYWTGSAPADHAKMVELQYELQARHSGAIRIADTLTPTKSATGACYAQGSAVDPYADDVHPKYLGAIKWGDAVMVGLGDWIPAAALMTSLQADAANSANKVTNPTFTGAAGTAVGGGTAPTSWTANRTAGDSWDKSYIWGANHTMRANSTVYAAGDRISSTLYPAFDYLCTAGGSSAAAEPAMSQVLFGSTTDNAVTWLTVPKFSDFDGITALLAYGAGTVDNTRLGLQQDISMASAGFAVGDTIVATMAHVALLPSYGIQLEARAMTGTTKVQSAIGLASNYQNSTLYGAYPRKGRLITPTFTATKGFVIPAGADTIRVRACGFSKNGATQAHLFAMPVLRKL